MQHSKVKYMRHFSFWWKGDSCSAPSFIFSSLIYLLKVTLKKTILSWFYWRIIKEKLSAFQRMPYIKLKLNSIEIIPFLPTSWSSLGLGRRGVIQFYVCFYSNPQLLPFETAEYILFPKFCFRTWLSLFFQASYFRAAKLRMKTTARSNHLRS